MNQEFGRGQSLPDPAQGSSRLALRAGSLELEFMDGELRHIRWGQRELIQRIYFAVRDANWGTVPGTTRNLHIELHSHSFQIRFLREHRQGPIHYSWNADIRGQEDGSLRFRGEGRAHSTFLRNRIGFCILHPISECAGTHCQAHYTDGTERGLRFPHTIAPVQPLHGSHNLTGLSQEFAPGIWAEVSFKGEVFEMEDQRNWIDASFKTYGTPLSLPFPVEIQAGTPLQQEVSLRLAEGKSANSPTIADSRSTTPAMMGLSAEVLTPEEITLSTTGESHPLPEIGLGVASHGQPLDELETKMIRNLNPAYLRLGLRFSDPEWRTRLDVALRDAERIDRPLELALTLSENPHRDLTDLNQHLTHSRSRSLEFLIRTRAFKRIIVLTEGCHTTQTATFQSVRGFLNEMGVPIHELALGGGTDADFCQLNQFRPNASLFDFVCWSMNPQVHAFDDDNLMTTPQGIRAQVQSAKEIFEGAPLVISPITLKPRFNPVATRTEERHDDQDRELPQEVDVRQRSRFGAAWTLAAFKALAESGAQGVTFYETTGWRGVVETASGSPLPERFPSDPRDVFPIYHVLADIGEFSGGEVVVTRSSRTAGVESLLLRFGSRTRLLVANLSDRSQRLCLGKLPIPLTVRKLDELTYSQAAKCPVQFRSEVGSYSDQASVIGPHTLLTLDSVSD